MRKLLMVSVNRYDVLPSFDASKRIDVQYSPWYEEWMVQITIFQRVYFSHGESQGAPQGMACLAVSLFSLTPSNK